MKRSDDSLLISHTWACRATRRSSQAVRRWRLPSTKKGRTTYYQATAVFNKVREIESSKSPQAELATERAALARSQRRRIDRENNESEKFLLDARTVAREWEHFFTIVRSRFLNLSAQLQQVLMEEDVANLARREIEKALGELADYGKQYEENEQ